MMRLEHVGSAELGRLRRAVLDRSPVSLGIRRTASPHEFYRYPARFAPSVAAAAIDAFSDAGDTVADYFVGGGTTLVEARLAARVGIGSDINSLATFVSRVKTRTYEAEDLRQVRKWLTQLDSPEPYSSEFPAVGLPSSFRNFDGLDTELQRRVILGALSRLSSIDSMFARDLARCIVLRTAQWALDMRREIPSSELLASSLPVIGEQMLKIAESTSKEYEDAATLLDAPRSGRSLIVQQALPGLAGHPSLHGSDTPSLVFTSPPYPGVYVNYHRWKLRGRLETPLPYHIAAQQDGHGIGHYTGATAVRGALQASCDCTAGSEPGIVLDPFMGSGSTAVAAEAINRDWLGIEINPEFADIAEARIGAARAATDKPAAQDKAA